MDLKPLAANGFESGFRMEEEDEVVLCPDLACYRRLTSRCMQMSLNQRWLHFYHSLRFYAQL